MILTIEQIENPKSNFSVIEKLHNYELLKRALEVKLRKIQRKKAEKSMQKMYKSCNRVIIIERIKDEGNEHY